jgi:hypothetical protein
MSKLTKFVRSSCLWLLLSGWAIYGLGAASNQAVLIANHDKFPVMLNAKKLNQILSKDAESDIEKIFGVSVQSPLPTPDPDGMIDDTHCAMTKYTHLNALADVFDVGSIYSIGDFMLYTGKWLNTWVPFAWFLLICKKLWDEEQV